MDQPGSPTPPSASRRRWLPLAVAGVVVLVAVVGGVVWFLRDDAPDAVNLAAATAALEQASTSTSAAAETAATVTPPSTPAAASGGTGTSPSSIAAGGGSPAAVSGMWTVDTSIGEFDFQNSTGSFVGFRVKEELSTIGSTTAVGRTPAVAGTLVIGDGTVSGVDITADLTELVTDDSRRDSRARGALGTGQFPTATFALRNPIPLGNAIADGKPVSVVAEGDLTIKGVTRAVRFPLEAKLTGDVIVVVGSLDIVFADYGVQVPTAPIVVSAEDHGPIELQLFFRRS